MTTNNDNQPRPDLVHFAEWIFGEQFTMNMKGDDGEIYREGEEQMFMTVDDIVKEYVEKRLKANPQPASQSASGMRWVKASERLPKTIKEVVTRHESHGDKHVEYRDRNSMILMLQNKVNSNIEWLDESDIKDISEDQGKGGKWTDDDMIEFADYAIKYSNNVPPEHRVTYGELLDKWAKQSPTPKDNGSQQGEEDIINAIKSFEFHNPNHIELPSWKKIKSFIQASLKSKEYSDWIEIKEGCETPKIKDDNSENVLVWNNGHLRVMAWCYIEADENSGYAWCDCGNDIYGDPEFDDEYKPTHWMPLPKPPKPKL